MRETRIMRGAAIGVIVGALPALLTGFGTCGFALWAGPHSVFGVSSDWKFFGLGAFALMLIGMLIGGFAGAAIAAVRLRQVEGRNCLRCGYDLRGLRERRCPECGTAF